MSKLYKIILCSLLFIIYTVPCAAQSDANLSLDLIEINFLENDQKLDTFQSDYIYVYKNNNKNPLLIDFTVNIFGDYPVGSILQSKLSTDDIPQEHKINGSSELFFTHTTVNPPFDQNITLNLALVSEEETISSTNKIFIVKEIQTKPALKTFFINNTVNNYYFLSVLAGLCLLSTIFILSYSRTSHIVHSVLIVSIASGLILIFYTSTSQTLYSLFQAGIIKVPGQEMTIQDKNLPQDSNTLSKLNENLIVSPALSTSWSNISPKIWEFILRYNPELPSDQQINSRDVISSIQNIISSGAPEKQYLSSIKQAVSINGNRLQFITKFPDPLLAHKLTKIIISPAAGKAKTFNNTDLFLSLEDFSDHSRAVRNENYFNLPFLENVTYYKTELYQSNQDYLQQLIKTQTVDIFDEPEISLWPQLYQNNYKIIPKINTRSLVLLTNRNNEFLKNSNFLLALKKILQSPKILQTSYYQYGQLATQFAPPGVVGYHPEIEEIIDNSSASELLGKAKTELGKSDFILNFHYPGQETKLAQVVRKELEKEGITIESKEIAEEDFEQSLQTQTSDFILIPLDFDLADIGPFLDSLIDSKSPFNRHYQNDLVDELIVKSRSELNSYNRLQLLQKIMQIITVDDPAGIPLLFKKSFMAVKKPSKTKLVDKMLQWVVLGWRQ